MEGERLAGAIAAVPPFQPTSEPLISKRLPLFTRLNFAVRVWGIQTFVKLALRVLRLLQASKFRAIAPTFTKRYQIRPTLESRVFLPKNYVSGSKLPLFLNIHGGGFVLCDPAVDDEFCHYLANHAECCVVSLDYRKAPAAPYPIPVEDCVELARAVLADDALPIDHSKVACGGFSAGGNLSLAIAQSDLLRDKIKAVVPVYPVTDFTKRYRGPYITTPDGKEDVLVRSSKLFNWAYVNPEQDLQAPTLSCVFATRKMLPQKMFFIGCEYDCLCNEASVMAKSLARVDGQTDPKKAWEENGIRWELIPEQQHGFDKMQRRGCEEIERQRVAYEMYDMIGAWLEKEAFHD